ncbi:MAG: PilZ domain-containing protein [Terracidiphilus sp.]
MTSNLKSVDDRRERQRFGISAPITVIIGQREIPGFTRNLSNRGVYFYLDLTESAPISGDFEFMVELPPEITLSTCCTIHCLGHVVRTDDTSRQLTGIAAEILHYSIQREAAA